MKITKNGAIYTLTKDEVKKNPIKLSDKPIIGKQDNALNRSSSVIAEKNVYNFELPSNIIADKNVYNFELPSNIIDDKLSIAEPTYDYGKLRYNG